MLFPRERPIAAPEARRLTTAPRERMPSHTFSMIGTNAFGLAKKARNNPKDMPTAPSAVLRIARFDQ
jgi:hypothetical protein